jgi:hypothetical protein
VNAQQYHQGELASLARQIRVRIDTYKKAISAGEDSAKGAARDFCHFVFQSHLLNLLRASKAPGTYAPEAIEALEADMQGLYEACKSYSLTVAFTPARAVSERLSAIETNLAMLARYCGELFSSNESKPNHTATPGRTPRAGRKTQPRSVSAQRAAQRAGRDRARRNLVRLSVSFPAGFSIDAGKGTGGESTR